MYLNKENESRAQSCGWTYETGYNQGFNMARAGNPNQNLFPQFSQAWHGHNDGFKAGEAARKRGNI